MQEAIVGSWAQESHLSVRTLGSLHELNHRFLDLAAARNGARYSPVRGIGSTFWSCWRNCPSGIGSECMAMR